MPNVLSHVTCQFCGVNFQVSIPETSNYAIAKTTHNIDRDYDESYDTICPQCKEELTICIMFEEDEDE